MDSWVHRTVNMYWPFRILLYVRAYQLMYLYKGIRSCAICIQVRMRSAYIIRLIFLKTQVNNSSVQFYEIIQDNHKTNHTDLTPLSSVYNGVQCNNYNWLIQWNAM